MKNDLTPLIQQVLTDLELPIVDFTVEHPQIESHGDYSTNVAMVLFPILKKQSITTYNSPRALAETIVKKLLVVQSSNRLIAKIEVAGPGFINFVIHPNYFINTLHIITTDKAAYGRHKQLSQTKVVVEYTDPNPFKEFHIGHLYSNIVGETISRLMETNGASVWRADYFGDVGMHVAKSIWGLLQKFTADQVTLEQLGQKPLAERIRYLGQAYALGATAYEDNPSAKEDIKILNMLIYKVAQRFIKETKGKESVVEYPNPENNPYHDVDLYKLYTTCRSWSLEYFETIYTRLGTKFSGYYPESMVGEYGYQLVKKHVGEVFEVGEQGAIIFPGKKHGLHDRVFINSLGLPTYECKELGLAPAKFEDFPYDKSIIVTGNEINDYFNVLIKAMSLVEPTLGNITTHIGHGMVRLPEGKMSSRTGKVVTGEWLLNKAKQAAATIIKEQGSNLENQAEVAEAVGMAAIRYTLLKTNIGRDVIFDFKESVSFTGNSGPYLQYTGARCHSVLHKAGVTEVGPSTSIDPSYTFNDEEMAVLKWLSRYPEVTRQAADQTAPHLVCEYAYELAQRYNTFYNKHSILGSETHPVNLATKNLRLYLTQAVEQVLKNNLHILGITPLERM